ncbi:uncharacterized protein [Musca autumnalis]|uniref:uncharacterized protein n=1 Tax=Musca autumnalis TaxID=221902 RepID=UPI003CF0B364
MSKFTNKAQMQHLVTVMESNPDIARGFHKGNKEALTRFWQKTETELNSMGPPTKCITEWKKVWADQKKYVRHKAAQNLKQKKGTGGGPNKEQLLSATEEAIYNLIGMKSSVEGVTAKSYGLSNEEATSSLQEEFLDEEFSATELEMSENMPMDISGYKMLNYQVA